jgi:hypothetical protein
MTSQITAAGVLRHHRKDVPGLHDVVGLRVPGHRHPDRPGTVRGGYSRADAGGRLDRDRERGPVRRAVVAHHQREGELPATLLGEREADEAARMRGHEIDRLGRHEVGGEDEIAFVLAVLRVDEDDHPPVADFVDDL